MGCDIHAFYEVKKGSTWYCEEELDLYRNYQLFAILASARNDDNFKPISEPLGLPPDVSDEVREEYRQGGYHHSTWLSLNILRNWNWDAVAGNWSGVVPLHEFKRFLRERTPPACYCQGVGDPDRTVDSKWLADAIASGALDPAAHYFTRIEWPVTYREAAGSRFMKVLDELIERADSDARIVMFFDN